MRLCTSRRSSVEVWKPKPIDTQLCTCVPSGNEVIERRIDVRELLLGVQCVVLFRIQISELGHRAPALFSEMLRLAPYWGCQRVRKGE